MIFPYTNEITATFQIYFINFQNFFSPANKPTHFKKTSYIYTNNSPKLSKHGRITNPIQNSIFPKNPTIKHFPPFPIEPFLPAIVQSSSRSRSPKIDFPKPATRFQSALVYSIYPV